MAVAAARTGLGLHRSWDCVVGSGDCGWSERAAAGPVRVSGVLRIQQCERPHAGALGDVCTRFGGLHPRRGRGVRYAGRVAPGSGVCTRRGGGTSRIWAQSPRPGCKPPIRVHSSRPGGALSPRRGCKPPIGVHRCPAGRRPPRATTPDPGAQVPPRRCSQPPSQVQTPDPGAPLSAGRRPPRATTPEAVHLDCAGPDQWWSRGRCAAGYGGDRRRGVVDTDEEPAADEVAHQQMPTLPRAAATSMSYWNP